MEPLREEGRRVSDGRGRVHRAGTGARTDVRARVRQHQAGTPRHLAAERVGLVRRLRQADRFRAGVIDPENGKDRAGHHLRQGQLHVARTGAGREPRRTDGPVRGGDHSLGAADWPSALSGKSTSPPPPPAGQVSKEKLADAAQASAEELLRSVRNPVIVAPSKRASRVPPELDRIALRALAPKLADRYPNCAAFADDLSEYLAKTAPATNAARVAKFLDGLYAEDLESDRAEHQTALAAARLQLGKPRAAVHDTAISGLTMPIVPTKNPRSLTSRHSSRGTVVGGSVDHARDRQRDEVSAAFAQTVASSSNPAGGNFHGRGIAASGVATACAAFAARAGWGASTRRSTSRSASASR